MKKLIFIIIPITFFLLSSCNNDPCNDIACGANAVCDQGVCNCVDGWSADLNGNCTIEDFCFNKDCGTNGICVQDETSSWCECDDGFELDADDKCNVEIRARFIGTWVGTHEVNSSGTSSVTYTITITPDSALDKAKMTNIMNITCPVTASPTESIITFNRFVYDLVSTCSSVNISANGYIFMSLLDENTLRVNTRQGIDLYEGIYTRQ